MSDEARAEIERRAADLAAHFGITVEEVRQQIVSALQGDAEPLSRIYLGRRVPRWKRFIPGWRRRAQRHILSDIAGSSQP